MAGFFKYLRNLFRKREHNKPTAPVRVADAPLLVSKPKWDDFEIRKLIGVGSFGKVYLARHKSNDGVYAIKVIQKALILRLKQLEHVLNERAILSTVVFPFVVRLHQTFQDKANLYMVLDYIIGGELFSLIRKVKKLPTDAARFYAAETLVTIEHLHQKNIAYRDIKPENILLDHEGHIKIVDFGFSKHLEGSTQTLCGTPEYIAPEIVLSKEYTCAVDFYSFGVLIFEMLAGYPPFRNENHLALYEEIVSKNIVFPPFFSSEAEDLVRGLCDRNVNRRYGNSKQGIQEIKTHPWFESIDWNMVVNKQLQPPYAPLIRNRFDCRYFEKYDPPPTERSSQSPDHDYLFGPF